MRVALDATPLTLATGGLRRYVSELSAALAREFPEDAYVLASAASAQNPLEHRWWLWGVQRAMARERIDVFHGTNFEVPYLPSRPSVLTLHDLSPWLDPAWHSEADRVRTRTPWLIRLALATMVVTPTEAIRREAIERFRIPPQRAVAVPEAAASVFHPVETLPTRPYFLFVGTLEPRKNIPVILDAWRALRGRADLVLAGECRQDFPAPMPEPGLRVVGAVSDDELVRLYSGATAVVHPSLYEGFGLPVLEAMQCGAPVLAARCPAVSEVAGGAAVEFDARDGHAWAEAMTFALEHPEWRAERRARSLERARAFSWQATARQTREVYADAIRRFGG